MSIAATSVKVGVRIRPLLPKEKHQAEALHATGPQSIQLKEQTYNFDHVFSSSLSQHALYTKTAAPMLKSFLEGYNVTIMAYGQTGSGKTHTMGTSDLATVEDPELQGLIPRFVNDLFENLKSNSFNSSGSRPSFRVKVSFLEIYGEDIYDLITNSTSAVSLHRHANSSNDRPSLLVREDESGRVFVQGQQDVEVNCAQAALDLLCIGSRSRITGSTAMNAGSSRSHAVYTVMLEQSVPSDGAAGSERIKRTGAEGQRLKEGIQINSGLFNLGQVINALADDQRIKSGAKAAFVPYRNSKLTHLLKDALGGNSQTLFLACVSPAESNESESQSTLQYAKQARNIQNKPVKNMDKQQIELRRLRYTMQTWMMKAVSVLFDKNGADKEEAPLSPLPSSSPTPGTSATSDSELLRRPEVQDYISQVNLQIEERLRGSGPTPLQRRVRLSVLPTFHSPMRGGAYPPLPPQRAEDDENSFRSGHLADTLFSEGALRRGGHRDSVLNAIGVRDSVFESQDPEETEKLVARMIEMVNKEKEICTQDLEGETAIVVIDEEIEEKEQILSKLLDTVKGYSAMKTDFEKLLGAIEGLESERAQLELDLEKAKTASSSASSGAAVEKIKERFAKVQGELKQMKEERKSKENAYKVMQRESKQIESLQKELTKLKESKVSLVKAQKQSQSALSKAKKETVSKIASLKKNDVKKQRQVNTLKNELVKKERVLGHKDREIGRMNSKLRACEEHITQLLKIQNRNRQRIVTTGSTSASSAAPSSAIALSDCEREHFLSSKAVLESISAEQVERRCVNILYEKKALSLGELNKELVAEMLDLDQLLHARKQLLNGQHEDDFEEPQDGGSAVSSDQIAEYRIIKEGISSVESNIDRITRELDFFNADLDDLAGRLEGGDEGAKGDAMAREIVSNFSAQQLQLFVMELIQDKLESGISSFQKGENIKHLTESYEGVRERAQEQEVQIQALKAELKDRLDAAERQRINEMWSLLRAQSATPGATEEASEMSSSLQLRTAIQRACDLEREIESSLAVEEALRLESNALRAQVGALRSELGGKEMLAVLGGECAAAAGSGAEAEACLLLLNAAWDELGVPEEQRRGVVRGIADSSRSTRSGAVEGARSLLQKTKEDIDSLKLTLQLLCRALDRDAGHYIDSKAAAQEPQLLPQLALYESAVSLAVGDTCAKAKAVCALKEKLLDLVAEMWIDSASLPACLQVLTELPSAEYGTRAECAVFAEHLQSRSIVLRGVTLQEWEAEIKKVNLARAAVTSKMVAAKSEAAELLRSLDVCEVHQVLEIVHKCSPEDVGSLVDASNATNKVLSVMPSMTAAVSLVLSGGASNPPGSQKILDAMGRLLLVFQGVRASRTAVYRALQRLRKVFVEAVTNEPLPATGCEYNHDALGVLLSSSLAMHAQLIIAKDTQRTRLLRLLEAAKIDNGEDKIIALLGGSLSSAVVCSVLSQIDDCYEELRGASDLVEEAWVSAHTSVILYNHTSKGGCDLLRDTLLLGEEVSRLEKVTELLAELVRHDNAMAKMVAEMEEFEGSSKNNRSALLSGNSKALVEEERFRKNGKKRYEALSEKIVSAAMQLQTLASGAGGALPVSVDLSFLAPASAALLRSKSYYSEIVELMHLHTMTHGAHRWSAGDKGDEEKEPSQGPLRSDNNENVYDGNCGAISEPKPAMKGSRLPTSKGGASKGAEQAQRTAEGAGARKSIRK